MSAMSTKRERNLSISAWKEHALGQAQRIAIDDVARLSLPPKKQAHMLHGELVTHKGERFLCSSNRDIANTIMSTASSHFQHAVRERSLDEPHYINLRHAYLYGVDMHLDLAFLKYDGQQDDVLYMPLDNQDIHMSNEDMLHRLDFGFPRLPAPKNKPEL